MRPLHDFNIHRYEIRSTERKIVLHVELGLDPKNFGIAVFENVIGHHFQHTLDGNIILSLQPVQDTSTSYSDNKNELQRYQKFGLRINTETENSCIADLKTNNLKVFELCSSYGVSGWVIAGRCTVEIDEL